MFAAVLLVGHAGALTATTENVQKRHAAFESTEDQRANRMQKQLADWPNLDRYRNEKHELPPASTVQ